MDENRFRWALGIPEMTDAYKEAEKVFDKTIPNCDPRIKTYFFSKVNSPDFQFKDNSDLNQQIHFTAGYGAALLSVCKDLNSASMEAKFSEIIAKLNEI